MVEHIVVSRTVNLGNYNSRRVEYKHEFNPAVTSPITAFIEAEDELDKMIALIEVNDK